MLETLKIENGLICNAAYHNRRMNAARKELFGITSPLILEQEIRIPDAYRKGTVRCRVICSQQLEEISLIPFVPRTIKKMKTIQHNRIDYHLKLEDRSLLHALYARKGEADEIIIIKNGLVTDCTIGNLVFYDGKGWITPDTPLLEGTQRQVLLESGKIRAERILKSELPSFSYAGIINAFYKPGNMPLISSKNILIE
ncbi:MAG: aminotransferase class IV [Mangrovibacterium sp.]